MPDSPAVGFELRFTGTSGSDAAAQSRQVGARSGEPRQGVLKLGQLDLQLAFVSSRAMREDVEDELRAIDHAPAGDLLEVSGLAWRDLVVDDHDGRAGLLRSAGQELGLAAADQRGRIGSAALLHDTQHDVSARRSRQAGQFVQGDVRVGRMAGARGECDKDGALARPLRRHPCDAHSFVNRS